jgi:hypothetical protein
MMDNETVQAAMADGMPEGWSFTVTETAHKFTLRARRQNNAGRYECSFGKQDRSALSDFIAMCKMFAERKL